jgi:hypothetical protein
VCGTAPRKNIRVPQIFKKFPAFYTTRRFILGSTCACDWFISCIRSSPFGTTTVCGFPPSQPVSLQALLSLALSFQFFTFSFLKSSMTHSCHRCLGLPTGLFPIDFQFNNFLGGLSWSILCIRPSHLILCALMNLTISAPYIDLSISIWFLILHILSILTESNIFLSICLLKNAWVVLA